MAVLLKEIKPQRLRQDVFRLEFLNALRRMGTKVKKDYMETVATWEHKPKFQVLVSLTGGGPTLVVDTDSEIYRYVTMGTRPHLILPKGKFLAFSVGGAPKTRPRVIGSGPGMPGTTPVVRPYVKHPGTQAREFHLVIAEKWQSAFKKEMEEAMRKAVAKSGHRI